MLHLQPSFLEEDEEDGVTEEIGAAEPEELENGEYSLPIKKRRRLQESCMQESFFGESTKSEVPPYSENLLHMMADLQKEGLFCDVHLRSTTTNKSFLAHKVVLASISPYLKSLLSSEPRSIAVINMDVSESGIQDLLDFLYSGVLSLHETTAPELCSIAAEWDIKSLLKLCKGEDEVPGTYKTPASLSRMAGAVGHNDTAEVLNLTTTHRASAETSPMATKVELELPEKHIYSISPISASPRDERGLEHREQDPFLGVTVKQEPCDDSVSQGDSNAYDTDVTNDDPQGDFDRPHIELGAGQSPLQDGLAHLDRRIIGSVHLDDGPDSADQLLPPADIKTESDPEDRTPRIQLAEEVEDLDEVMLWRYREDDEDSQERVRMQQPEYVELSSMQAKSGKASSSMDMILCRCYVCKVLFPSMADCVNHMVESHGITKEAALLVLRSSQVQVCSNTEEGVVTAPKSNAAIQQKTGSRLTLYQCTVCRKHYATLSRCRNHIRSVHGQEMDVTAFPDRLWEDEPYHCYICKMAFPNAQEGRAHSIVVHCHGQRRKAEMESRNGESRSSPPANSSQALAESSSSPAATENDPITPPVTVQLVDSQASASPSASSGSSAPKAAADSTSKLSADSSETKGQTTDFYPFPNHPYQCKLCKTVFEFLDECEGHIMETHNIAAELVYVCYTRRKNRYRRFSNRRKAAEAAQASTSSMPSFATFSASRVSDPPRNLPYKCRLDPDNCLNTFQSPLDQEYHNYLDHGIPLPAWVNNLQCPKCVRNYRNKAALSSHLMKMHRPDEWP